MNRAIAILITIKAKSQDLITNQFNFIEIEHVRNVKLFYVFLVSCVVLIKIKLINL